VHKNEAKKVHWAVSDKFHTCLLRNWMDVSTTAFRSGVFNPGVHNIGGGVWTWWLGLNPARTWNWTTVVHPAASRFTNWARSVIARHAE